MLPPLKSMYAYAFLTPQGGGKRHQYKKALSGMAAFLGIPWQTDMAMPMGLV